MQERKDEGNPEGREGDPFGVKHLLREKHEKEKNKREGGGETILNPKTYCCPSKNRVKVLGRAVGEKEKKN